MTRLHALQRTPSVTIGRQPLRRDAKAYFTAEDTCNLNLHFVETPPFRAGRMSFDRAIFDADNSDTTTIDIYAFDPEPLQDRGFEIRDEQPNARAYYLARDG